MGLSSINHPAIGVSTILGTTHTYISSKSANLCCKSSLWKDNEFCSGGKWNNKYNSYGWMRRTNVIMIISGNIPWHGQIKPLWMPKPLSLPYPFLSIQNTKKNKLYEFPFCNRSLFPGAEATTYHHQPETWSQQLNHLEILPRGFK
jgi:hypothetical protein